jgi:hypothetical protein
MSYKNDSDLTILNSYGKASGAAKAELYETYDRIRDLAVSGPTMSGSGMGKFSSFLVNIARSFGSSSFIPTMGSEAINIPGTSYFTPSSGGTGIVPGGQASFGLAPFSQITGLPTGGAADISGSSPIGALSPMSLFQATGIGSNADLSPDFTGIGSPNYPMVNGTIGGLPANGVVMGGAAGDALATAGGVAAGTVAGAGFGRNFVLPLAGLVSGIGGILTTLGPYFGPYGVAGVAAGALLNGISGAVINSFENVANRVLANADSILSDKVHNLEATVKQLDAQQDIVKKLLKESLDGDKKALDNL